MYNELLIKYNSLLYKANTENDGELVSEDMNERLSQNYQILRMRSPKSESLHTKKLN
jgi:hypothetical protein